MSTKTTHKSRRMPFQLALTGLIILYILSLGWLSLARHFSFQTAMADLGLNHQPVWGTLHGRPFYRTGGSSLADHFEPIIILLAPFLAIWQKAETLLIIQATALALGAIPVFWLARDKLKSDSLALVFAAAYLLMPAVEAPNAADFHPAPLAAPLFLFACYYAYRRQPLRMAIFALLTMLVREDMAYLTLLLGLYTFFRLSRPLGFFLIITPVIYDAIALTLIVPHYAKQAWGQEHPYIFLTRYAYLGRSGLHALLTTLFSRDRIAYGLGLLAGAGFLPLLAPEVLVWVAPFYLLNILSDYPATYSGELHYSAHLVPFLMLAAIYGTARILERASRATPRLKMAVGIWLLLWSLGYHHLRGFTPLTWGFSFPRITKHHRLLSHFEALIPPGAPLSTTTALYPHFSNRFRLYPFPTVADAEYVLLDVTSTTDMHPSDFHRRFRELPDEGFGILEATDGYILLKRGARSQTLPDSFYDFARSDAPSPRYRVEITFGDMLRFRGFDVEKYREGKLLYLRTYWEPLRPLAKDLRLYPFILNAKGEIVQSPDIHPLPTTIWYPPHRWRPGETVVVETIPWDYGDYFVVSVGVVMGDDWSRIENRLPITAFSSAQPIALFSGPTWAQLLALKRRSHPFCRLLPLERCPPRVAEGFDLTPSHEADAIFGGKMKLWGYDVYPSSASPGHTLDVTLYWETLTQMYEDYSVFVHLVDEQGRMVTQHDGPPTWFTPMGTSTWVPGERYRDAHRLRLPEDIAPGYYRIVVGVYRWQDLKRLPVKDGDSIPLTTVLVREG